MGEDLRLADLYRLVPLLIGLMGIINLISAILPRSGNAPCHACLPLEVTQRSRPLADGRTYPASGDT